MSVSISKFSFYTFYNYFILEIMDLELTIIKLYYFKGWLSYNY